MISRISQKIAYKLYDAAVIENTDIELYSYGLFILISYWLFFIISISCGVVLKTLVESIVFYVLFSLLRVYSGGVHASREWICTLCTSVSILVCNLLIKLFMLFNMRILPFLICFGAVVSIFILCPLESQNKPLSKREKLHFRRVSIGILLFALCLVPVLLIFKKYSLIYAVILSMVLEGALLIIGMIQNKVQTKV